MEPIIKVDNVSMCFNLSTEKHESLKEYLLAMAVSYTHLTLPTILRV